MTEGVAEIEQCALAGLALVARHGRRLGPTAHRDRVFARSAAGTNLPPIGFQPGKERGVSDEAVFGDLGITSAEFAWRQAIEQRSVGHHQYRLVEGTNQVLAMTGIDRGLAADR